jgi:hypothetical protein
MTYIQSSNLISWLQRRLHGQLRLSILVIGLVLAGCGDGRESLHELAHVMPAHWPSDMADAANKISERLVNLQAASDSSVVREELRNIIEWVPEIAADTDLPEQEWLPIYQLSETLRKHMNARDLDLSYLAEDFSRLVELLNTAHESLPSNPFRDAIRARFQDNQQSS